MNKQKSEHLLEIVLDLVVNEVCGETDKVKRDGMAGVHLTMDQSLELGQALSLLGTEMVFKSMSMAAGFAQHTKGEVGKDDFKRVILNMADDIHGHSMKCVAAMASGEEVSPTVVFKGKRNEH